MGFFSFNKRVKHQQFGYKPRFYDPAKEELEERLRGYRNNEGLDDTELSKARIRSGLRSKSGYAEGYRSQQVRKSNYSLILIIITLGLITYVVLKSDRILNILEQISN